MHILSLHRKLIKKGAEADIFLIAWYGRKAISKMRNPKQYRNKYLDENIRKKRTLHEANMLSAVKNVDIKTPSLLFLDPLKAEIIMEYIDGHNVKDIMSSQLALDMGKYTSLLHNNKIVHGDLTTSNFIKSGNDLVIIDFGLSFFSDRIEDRAVDFRLIKEILSSAHIEIFDQAYQNFITGYSNNTNNNMKKILRVVSEIEKRGRYARIS